MKYKIFNVTPKRSGKRFFDMYNDCTFDVDVSGNSATAYFFNNESGFSRSAKVFGDNPSALIQNSVFSLIKLLSVKNYFDDVDFSSRPE